MLERNNMMEKKLIRKEEWVEMVVRVSVFKRMITVGLTERWLFILKLSLFHNAIIYFERSNFHIFSCIPIEYEPKKVCKNTSSGDRMYWKKLVGECAILVRMKGATNHARKLNVRRDLTDLATSSFKFLSDDKVNTVDQLYPRSYSWVYILKEMQKTGDIFP